MTTEKEEKGLPQPTLLLKYAENLVLFRAPDGIAYATLPGGEHCPIKSKQFEEWLAYQFYKETRGAPASQSLSSVQTVLSGMARFEGKAEEVYLRVAYHDGRLYLDLANKERDIWCITPAGWFKCGQENPCPVRFRRPAGMLPLPTPQHGGDLLDLRDILNPELSDNDWVLLVGWLLGCLLPEGDYPQLILNGVKGSAKSSTARYLRQMLDPNKVLVPKPPRNEDAFTLKAENNFIMAYDNMSRLPQWLSDDLCMLSTGSSDSKRSLYANRDEELFEAKRPAIINGIEQLATASDLLDRAVIVELEKILPAQRRKRKELDARFKAAHPLLLGALLDAAVKALANQDTIDLEDEAPRMIDWATFVVAAEQELSWDAGTFLAVLAGNREEAEAQELEADVVASTLLKFMDARGGVAWVGIAEDLLTELATQAGKENLKKWGWLWPANGQKLSGKLARAEQTLRTQGITWEKKPTGARRLLRIESTRQDGVVSDLYKGAYQIALEREAAAAAEALLTPEEKAELVKWEESNAVTF
jgi:hypothetical protein